MIFDKGYTTKNWESKAKEKAKGFGLYNVKQIVLQSGGELLTKYGDFRLELRDDWRAYTVAIK